MTESLYERILQLHTPARGIDYAARRAALMHAYRQLSESEARALAERADVLLDERIDLAEAVLGALSCYWPQVVPHQRCLDHELDTTPHIYRAAAEPIVAALFERLESIGRQDFLLLEALAWANGARVIEQFAAWRAQPPDWQLYVPPEAYAHEAGWTLTADDQRRDLFLTTTFRLVERGEGDESPVTVLRYVTETCPWCNRQLADLFDFDLTDPALAFMGLNGTRLRIRTCLACVSFQPVFAVATLDGYAAWRDHNPNPVIVDRSWDWNFPEDRLKLGEQRPTPYEALAVSFMFSSQVGGYPEWEQDAKYPICPVCQRPMLCVAQVETCDLRGEPADGHFYAFFCADCEQAATDYQQT